MRLLTIRMEAVLKRVIQKYADSKDAKMSQTIRDLIDLGIGYAQEKPVTIQGPLEMTRPLSKLAYGDAQTRISVWLDEEQIADATSQFNEKETSAIREAIRLGFIMLHADKVRFTDGDTSVAPLAGFKKSGFKSKKADQALKRLTSDS